MEYQCSRIECGAVFEYERQSCGHHEPPNYCPDCSSRNPVASRSEAAREVEAKHDAILAHPEQRRCPDCGNLPTWTDPENPNHIICDNCDLESLLMPVKRCEVCGQPQTQRGCQDCHKSEVEAQERIRIGNTPTCDECGEQHSQDTSCEEYAEAQSWNRVTTEGEMLRESAKRVGFTG